MYCHGLCYCGGSEPFSCLTVSEMGCCRVAFSIANLCKVTGSSVLLFCTVITWLLEPGCWMSLSLCGMLTSGRQLAELNR